MLIVISLCYLKIFAKRYNNFLKILNKNALILLNIRQLVLPI